VKKINRSSTRRATAATRSGTSTPTRADLAAANNSVTVTDILAKNLSVLFVGINPGLYSGATGFHFARPGNRFWPALHQSGFTPRQLHPSESRELLQYHIGLTKLVHRATATAAEVSREEFQAGGQELERTVGKLKPRLLCFLGIGAYEQAFNLKRIKVGKQDHRIADAEVWVLPNPSGLNANHQLKDFVRMFSMVREAAGL
jgi:TDG/mug DNA glycosylase family protein